MRIATGNLNDNTKKRRFECLLILLTFKAVVSDNDQSSLFQTHRFTKTSVVLKSNLNAANQMCKRLSLIISQFNSSSEHGFALNYTDHLSFVSSGLEHRLALRTNLSI